MAAGLAHRIPENEIVKCFVNGLKEEMFSRSCDTLVEVMAAARADLATYRDILEISERVKKPEVKKYFKERPHYVASATNKNFPQRRSAVQVSFHPLILTNLAKISKKMI